MLFRSYHAGRPVAIVRQTGTAPAAVTFLTTDHLGTPVLVMDGAGLEVWEGGFESFGADYANAEGAGVFLRFPGQWVDGLIEEGGTYNLHRWYQAGTGRYGRVDPLLVSHDASIDELAYAYADSSPLFLTDPLGLATLKPGAKCPNFDLFVQELTNILNSSCQGPDCRAFFSDNFGLEIADILTADQPQVSVGPPITIQTVHGTAAFFNCGKSPNEIQLPFKVCKKKRRINPRRLRRGAVALYHELAHYADCNGTGKPFQGEAGCAAELACFGSVVSEDATCD